VCQGIVIVLVLVVVLDFEGIVFEDENEGD